MIVAAVVALLASACVINGTWTALATPAVPGADDVVLGDVSCVSDTWCMGVGYSKTGGVYAPLVQVFDGSAWSAAPAPTPGSAGGSVNSVDCDSTARCVAKMGRYGGYETEYLVGWDGTTWADLLPGAEQMYVQFDCVADGCVITDDGFGVTYVWDGVDLETAASGPNEGGGADTLACVTTSDCLSAQGWRTGRWDGTSWTYTSVPVNYWSVEDLACPTSTSDCIGVGRDGSTNPPTSLVATWDGTTWTERPVPLTAYSLLTDVSCASADECLILGRRNPSISGSADSLLTWNGVDVYVAPTAPGSDTHPSVAASCLPLQCLVVGYVAGPPPSSIFSRYAWTNP